MPIAVDGFGRPKFGSCEVFKQCLKVPWKSFILNCSSPIIKRSFIKSDGEPWMEEEELNVVQRRMRSSYIGLSKSECLIFTRHTWEIPRLVIDVNKRCRQHHFPVVHGINSPSCCRSVPRTHAVRVTCTAGSHVPSLALSGSSFRTVINRCWPHSTAT